MDNTIQKQIFFDVAENEYFSIFADEASGMSQTEQFGISVRFVNNNTIYEKFLCFISVLSITGKNLMTVILLKLAELSLNLDRLRGLDYDGASNVSGKISSVKAKIEEL